MGGDFSPQKWVPISPKDSRLPLEHEAKGARLAEAMEALNKKNPEDC